MAKLTALLDPLAHPPLSTPPPGRTASSGHRGPDTMLAPPDRPASSHQTIVDASSALSSSLAISSTPPFAYSSSPSVVGGPSSDVFPSAPISTTSSSSRLPLHHPIPTRHIHRHSLLLHTTPPSIVHLSSQLAPSSTDDQPHDRERDDPTADKNRVSPPGPADAQPDINRPDSPPEITQEGACGVGLDEPLFADRARPQTSSWATTTSFPRTVAFSAFGWGGDVHLGKRLNSIKRGPSSNL